MIYIITYEINKNKDHAGLFEALKSYEDWWHYIDSTWLIKTNATPRDVTDKLLSYMDKVDDSLLVIKADIDEVRGWLPKKAWEWVKKHQS